MPEGPLLLDLAGSPAPPSGIVALQWRLQDGSWQDPSSWSVNALFMPHTFANLPVYTPCGLLLISWMHWHPYVHTELHVIALLVLLVNQCIVWGASATNGSTSA